MCIGLVIILSKWLKPTYNSCNIILRDNNDKQSKPQMFFLTSHDKTVLETLQKETNSDRPQ